MTARIGTPVSLAFLGFICNALTYDIQLLDDPDTFQNAPISIQVVGRTLDDEAVIGMSEIVDSAVKAYQSESGLV